MKLPLKRSKLIENPAWHPDFRSADQLPDLKVVRTSFFVNMLWVTAAAAAVLFTGYREFTAASLASDIVAAEEHIAANTAANTRALQLNREFVEAARKFAEADKFGTRGFKASELIKSLATTLPNYMDFTSIVFEGDKLKLSGTIRGASDSASARLSSYLDVLRTTEYVAAGFSDVSLTSMLRDAGSQGLSFEIMLKPKAPDAPKA